MSNVESKVVVSSMFSSINFTKLLSYENSVINYETGQSHNQRKLDIKYIYNLNKDFGFYDK